MADEDLPIKLHFRRDQLITIVAGFGIALGVALLVLGITGSITLQAEANKVSGKLINASPGAVIAVLGFVVLGIQVVRRPSVRIRKRPAGWEVVLHESGPVFVLSEGLGVRLNRPFDRDPRGDHWYGDPIDSMIDRLTKNSLHREESSPRTTIVDTESVSIERTIGSLVEAWNRSASIERQGGRTVIINIGGEWKDYQFEGGHTYEGKLAKEQLGFVLHVLGVLAQRKGVGSAA